MDRRPSAHARTDAAHPRAGADTARMDGSHRSCWIIAVLAAAILQIAAIPVHFAVIGNVPDKPAQEEPVRAMLAAIANRPDITFILDDGNFKGPQESCSDALLEDRIALLNSAPLPLVLIPGAADWVDCQQPAAGAYDPLERLDFLRDSAFSAPDSMGTAGLPLERESDFARFGHFHENTLWQQSNVLFVGLDVVGHNNHYLDAGGRNGEFEDRTIANRFWLEHALRVAHERRPTAVVIAIQGDPGLSPVPRRGPFDWLNFRLSNKRDGYQEFKQDLARFAQQFDGPILLIHQMRVEGAPAQTLPFRLLPPAHRRNGGLANRIWQLELGPHGDPDHWLQVEISAGREFSVRAQMQVVSTPAAGFGVVTGTANGTSGTSGASGVAPANPGAADASGTSAASAQ